MSSVTAKRINAIGLKKEVLGAVRWFYHHPQRLLANFEDGTIPYTEETCNLTGLSQEELIQEWKDGLSQGYAPYLVTRIQIRVGGQNAEVLGFPHSAINSSYLVDGRHLFTDEDQALRFQFGPRWSNNSCAVDSILVVLLHLEAGRCQADQVSEHLLQSIPSMALSRLVFFIVRHLWSRLTQDEIDQKRDTLRHALQHHNPEFQVGQYIGLASAFEEIAAGIPQLLTSWGVVARCCSNGGWQWYTGVKGSIVTKLRPTHYTPGSALSAIADAATWQEQIQASIDVHPWDYTACPPRCSKCENSPGIPDRLRVVLDRLPLTLAFTDFNLPPYREGMFGPLDLEFSIRGSKGTIERIRSTYVCWGCIYTIRNHFVVLINVGARESQEKFVFYDGMARQGKITDTKLTFQDYAAKAGVAVGLLFYVRQA